ncbi:MAG: DEAD/DEAH box helicase [Actinomycetes bacterium]
MSRPTSPSPRSAALPPAFPDRAPWGTAPRLRAWQSQALQAYQARADVSRDFLAVATPGAGKTTFALQVAAGLRAAGGIAQVVVVAPTEHLKYQWAQAAVRAGIELDPTYSVSAAAMSAQYHGVAVTYAGVAANSDLMRRRVAAQPTLVILDEVHHAGDALAWGEAVRLAFAPAVRRLALTGTPFRSDVAPIPYVTYAADADGVRRSRADYTYGYAQALADGVVRPVLFLAYTGQMRWRTRAGDEVAARLGEPMTADLGAQSLRTALDPGGEWIPVVLAAADRRLTEVRRTVPDAAGLVIATDRSAARAYAGILRRASGEAPVVVVSDDPSATDRIRQFAHGQQRWMVAVRMVSEGVDVPRLSVGVYATSVTTPLFFAQAVGRLVRARRRGETASVFLPSVPVLLGHAAALEAERDHVLDRRASSGPGGEDLWSPEESLLAAAAAGRRGGEDSTGGSFEALEAQASFDRVLFDGGEFGTEAAAGSADEEEYLGLPGLLDRDQVRLLLRRRQSEQVARHRARPPASTHPAPGHAGATPPPAAPALHERTATVRKELAGLVGAWHRRTGTPHAMIHAELRAAGGGPVVAQASIDQIQARIDLLRQWADRVRR